MADGTFAGLLQTLDPDPHTRGKQFEKLVKWWAQNDPIHSREIKQIWLWNEWPDRSGPDIGIDLVALMHDGTHCAIQAKCHDPERDIPKSELDSFISAASPRKFKHRWLVASTDGLSANAKRALADNHVTQILYSYLDSLEDFWPASLSGITKPAEIKKAIPRPHQQEAIKDVVEGLQKASRGQLIMACGTGKTLTALWITEALKPRTTLVLVPSLSLLSQTLSEWAKNTNTKWNYLCVCSDETVNKSDDAPISTTDELPFDVTTKPADIANFLNQRGHKILFSTYQSSAQVAKATKTTGTKFDLMICDEAHRLTGKNDADFSTALDDEKIPAKKRLFMTATPRTYTASVKAKASERGVEITSMDDPTIFGYELHKLSFGQAIEQDLLTDYRVVIVGVSDPQVQDLVERRELVSIAGKFDTDARTLAAHIGLAMATKQFDLKRTISFHGRIKSAQDFARNHAQIISWMPDHQRPLGTVWADSITGAMRTSDRRVLLNRLRDDMPGRHALLSNARCLTEGIDVPTLDGVAFIDPRSSQVDIIQAVGRAIRKAPDKTQGTIILPVLLPSGSEAEQIIGETAFRPIWAVLNALRSHDEGLADRLDQLRTELGKTSQISQLPAEFNLVLPADIDTLLPNFTEKLNLLLIEKSTSTWDYMYGLLLKFVDENGHARPLARKTSRTWFEQWVADQRSRYKKNRLSETQVKKLESLPGWSWDPLGESWENYFKLLLDFADEFGHSSVPIRPRLYRGMALGSWVNSQRTRYNKNDLPDDKIRLLESAKGWTWSPKTDQFERGFQALKNYTVREHTSRVPRGHIEEFNGTQINLGSWCQTRRNEYKSGAMPQKQIERFESLPDWTWDPIGDAWESWFERLQRFGQVNGHYLVPHERGSSKSNRNESLGSWVNTQRQRFKNGSLEPERARRLESLNGWSWSPQDDTWNQWFKRVKTIAEDLGTIDELRETDKDSQSLRAWINTQRTKRAEGSLRPERSLRLETIPGWTWEKRDVHVESWNVALEALQTYVKQHGRLPYRSTQLGNFRLGEWVKQRRTDHNSGRLSQMKVSQLESIPGWTWDPFAEQWDDAFDEVRQLSEQHPSGLPAAVTNKSTSNWITRQRKLYARGNLSKDRIERLESIAGWSWNSLDLKRSKWMEMYSFLLQYTVEHGTARVRDKAIYKERALGTWVAVQRRRYQQGSILNEEIDLLERLPHWSWNPIEDDWKTMYRQVLTHCQANGGKMPRTHVPSEYEMGQWVGVQRAAYKSGKMNLERSRLLTEIPGWLWSARDEKTLATSWQRSYLSLLKHIKNGGNLSPPKNLRVDGISIATWITTQRKKFADGKLDHSQIQALEEIGSWTWDPFEDTWSTHFEKTANFAKRRGHARVPQRHLEDGIDIGTWVNSQRTKFKRGQLSQTRVDLLESLPGWSWSPKTDTWNFNFQLLKTYLNSSGSSSITESLVVEGVKLGLWASKQRQKRKAGKLSSEQEALLASLPNWKWTVRS